LKDQPSKEWYIIVNPHAGSKKTQRDWPHIIQLLDGEGIVFQSVFTEFQYHATELARKAIVSMGHRKIIVVGGDGTLNEVLNGIITQNTVATTDIMLGSYLLVREMTGEGCIICLLHMRGRLVLLKKKKLFFMILER